MKPSHQKKSGKPTKFHCYDSCNKCGEVNEVTTVDTINGHIAECRTKCKTCGFKDYWAHGWFESSQEIKSKCNTYSFS